jgi:hypothetical protein
MLLLSLFPFARMHSISVSNVYPRLEGLSWKCRRFRCRPQLVLTTWFRVFPTRRPDTADVSATSCDVGFFFSVSYVVSLPNCRHVVVVLIGAICHVLVGAKSIITRAGTRAHVHTFLVTIFGNYSLFEPKETTATNPKQPFFLA